MSNPISNWRRRHRKPANFWLHVPGITACFLAAPVLLILRQWPAALVCFVAGYALQFLGHALEGNRSGEEMLLRRILRKNRGK